MPFEVIWTARAKKDLKLVDKPIAGRILRKVDSLGELDVVFLEKVVGKDFYKFRIGSYRVLIDKFSATGKLLILRVKHRRNAYKNI